MSTPIRASDQDLRALAAIVSQDRPDLPDGDGLPPSLLTDLMGQIRCDGVDLLGFDTGQQAFWLGQEISPTAHDEDLIAAVDRAFWQHYWDSRFCNYPGRTGDLGSIIKITDFYSTRQWHSTGMYTDHDRLLGVEHCLMLCLPEAPGRTAGPARHLRLYLSRGPGPGFSERDRAVLTLLRPHLHQAYLDAERRRHPVPRLTPRQNDLLCLVAAGHTNTQIARRLGISEGTVRTHLENIYERLGVSSRTAAVTRAFPDRAAQAHQPGEGGMSRSSPFLLSATHAEPDNRRTLTAVI
jgi:DNA-binding CsgD family transcriptional regulator